MNPRGLLYRSSIWSITDLAILLCNAEPLKYFDKGSKVRLLFWTFCELLKRSQRLVWAEECVTKIHTCAHIHAPEWMLIHSHFVTTIGVREQELNPFDGGEVDHAMSTTFWSHLCSWAFKLPKQALIQMVKCACCPLYSYRNSIDYLMNNQIRNILKPLEEVEALVNFLCNCNFRVGW